MSCEDETEIGTINNTYMEKPEKATITECNLPKATNMVRMTRKDIIEQATHERKQNEQ